MASPTNARAKEIVDEIARVLAGKDIDRLSEFERLPFDVSINSAVSILRALSERRGGPKPLWGYRSKNLRALKELAKSLEQVESSLTSAPDDVLVLLSMRDVPSDLTAIPDVAAAPDALRRLKHLAATIEYARRRCQALLESAPGEHASAGFQQRQTAEEAWALLHSSGVDPGKGDYDSNLGCVARLLFEAAWGEEERDLERACKAALKRARDGDLRVRGRTIGRGRIDRRPRTETSE